MSELRVLLAAMMLAAGVAAAVSAGIVKLGAQDGPTVASVRLAEIVAAESAVVAKADAETVAAATRAWARALEAALAEVAARHGAVLLPARAVAAGAPDLTGAVEAAMARILGRTMPDAEAGR